MKNTIITSVVYVFILLNNIYSTTCAPCAGGCPTNINYILLFLNLRDCGNAWIVY